MMGRRQEINLQLNQLLDCALLAVGLWLGHWLRAAVVTYYWQGSHRIPEFSEFFWLLSIIAPFMPIILESLGFYENILSKKWHTSLRQVARAGLRVCLIVGFCEIFLKWNVESRAVVVLGGLIGATAILLRESALKMMMRRRVAKGHLSRERVLLAGEPREMDAVFAGMTDDQRSEIEVVGRYHVTEEPVERLVELLHANAVARVVFAVSHAHFARIEEAVQACETEGVEAWLSADFFQTTIARPTFDVLAGKLMLVFHTTPNVSWALWMKDLVDRVGAAALILRVLRSGLRRWSVSSLARAGQFFSCKTARAALVARFGCLSSVPCERTPKSSATSW